MPWGNAVLSEKQNDVDAYLTERARAMFDAFFIEPQ
jgi:hypothetical protein